MDAKLFEIDTKSEALNERLRRAGSASVGEFNEKLDLSWIFHDNGLEGVVVSYSELKAAIDRKIISDVSLIPMYDEIKDHKSAITEVRQLAEKRRQPITLEVIRRLYLGCTPEAAAKGAPYRKDNPLHRAYYHEIAAPDKISYRMRKLVEWLESDEARTTHPIHLAAKAHYRLLAVYPWPKNNGRVARLLQNLVLLRAGYLPAVIHATERQRYYEVLRHEHAGLIPLVTESLTNSLETAHKFFSEQEKQHSRAAG
jgi:Fic family protein